MALAVFSFNDSKSMAHWGGFTFKWYKQLIHNQSIMSALYYTLVVAIISSVVATIVGTISAIGIYKMSGRNRKLILNINSIKPRYSYSCSFNEFICICKIRIRILNNAFISYNV